MSKAKTCSDAKKDGQQAGKCRSEIFRYFEKKKKVPFRGQNRSKKKRKKCPFAI